MTSTWDAWTEAAPAPLDVAIHNELPLPSTVNSGRALTTGNGFKPVSMPQGAGEIKVVTRVAASEVTEDEWTVRVGANTAKRASE